MANFVLPDLPYSEDALEPVISKEIMHLHHKKHHNAYVTNLNLAYEKGGVVAGDADLDTLISLHPAIRFNGGGHINHTLFWENLCPESAFRKPKGALLEAIEKHFGSLDAMIEKFNKKVAPLQGSGWGWLGFCKESQSLQIALCSNQDPLFATTGMVPLLGIDVWEHAYYLQYKNVRPEYLKEIWRVINWDCVEKRFAKAIS